MSGKQSNIWTISMGSGAQAYDANFDAVPEEDEGYRGVDEEEHYGSEGRRTPLNEAVVLSITPRKRGRPPKGEYSNENIPSRMGMGTPPPLDIPDADGTERGDFLHDLYSFMQRIGQPITKMPHLGYQELDLYKLYRIVIEKGGMDEVTRRQAWKTVYQELGIPTMSTSASYNTRTNYKKYLYLYELDNFDQNDKRPIGMEPKFLVGEHVRIVSSNYDGQVFYAKVLKSQWRQAKNMYYVHYNGWSTSHDEWMPEGILSKLLNEETREPEYLTNPQPTRSSKSNYIIGELTGERSELKITKATRKTTNKSSESDDGGVIGSNNSMKSSLLEKIHERTKSMRLRLQNGEGRERGEDNDYEDEEDGGRHGRSNVRRSFRIETVKAELDKLETEKFLDYKTVAKPVFLTAGNMHRHANDAFVGGGLRPALLKAVDVRVPDLDELIGMPPSTENLGKIKLPLEEASLSKATDDDINNNDHNNRGESIKAMEMELRSIRKEYKLKKRLLILYYGSSDSSAESSTSSSTLSRSNNSDDGKPTLSTTTTTNTTTLPSKRMTRRTKT